MTNSGGYDPDDFPSPNYTLDEIAPDFTHWLRMDVWDLDEAIYLLLDIDPRMRAFTSKHQEITAEFFKVSEVARTAEARSLSLDVASVVYDDETGETRQGKVSPKTFVQWAHSKNYDIPEPLIHLLDSREEIPTVSEPNNKEGNLPQLQAIETDSKIDQRVQDIGEIAAIWFIDSMNIPDGGKTKLRDTLCKINPDLFTSSSTFDKAWQKAVKNNLVKMEDSEQYSKGK